jgi:hypothetical protein
VATVITAHAVNYLVATAVTAQAVKYLVTTVVTAHADILSRNSFAEHL